MGAKDSKLSFISYDDAVKQRVTAVELKRLKETFKRCAVGSYISKAIFFREVLGDSLPQQLAEQIFQAFGGQSKGVHFKDLVCGLIVLTRGKQEEKLKFLFALYSNDSCTHVVKQEFDKALLATEGEIPSVVSHLFREHDRVGYDEFREWVVRSRNTTSVIRWLISEAITLTLSDDSETPTFYQTLAGVTHLEESDIIELERRFWTLQNGSRCGLLDLETFRAAVSPPLSQDDVEGMFLAFDENRDGHIDFKEMACGISACSRGPVAERKKFLFRVFDKDADGLLNHDELLHMVTSLLRVRREARGHQDVVNTDPYDTLDAGTTAREILATHDSDDTGCLTQQDFLVWSVDNDIPAEFLKLLLQVCHVVLGLKPKTPVEEGEIVKGWLERDDRNGLVGGQTFYLVNIVWWRSWAAYVGIKLEEQAEHEHHTTAKHHRRQTDTLAEGGTLGRSNGDALHSNGGRSYDLSPRSRRPRDKNSSPQSQGGVAGVSAPVKPSAVDNSPLVDTNKPKAATLTNEGGRLRRGVERGRDYELISEPLWRVLTSWYGGGTPPLPRSVILPDGAEGASELEMYPTTVKIMRHQTIQAKTQHNTYFAGVMTSMAAHTMANAAASAANPNAPTIVRRYVASSASFSRCHTVKQVVDFLCSRLRVPKEDMRLWKFADEHNMTLLEEEDKMMFQLEIEDESIVLVEVRNKDLTWPEEIMLLAKNKNLDKKEANVPKGSTGLNNLGNTCFMNSALQCISHTSPLTEYFSQQLHRYELNKENPLGMKGHVAERYGQLITELWAGTRKTYAPIKFRWTIGKYAPQFNGFQQHDSQELLAFLLDGLHEDLNRVHTKPYVELKDSGNRPDEEVAREAWENHVLRNQSIIVDLFHGQLKSQVTCQTCGHVSSKFDPFTFLTLPLPMESCVHVEVVVVRINGKTPTKYGLRLGMDDKFSQLKVQLSQLCGVTPDQLMLAEILQATVKSLPLDTQKVRSSLVGNLYAYELPPTPLIPTLSAKEEMMEKRSVGRDSHGGGSSEDVATSSSSTSLNTPPDAAARLTPTHSGQHSRQSSCGGTPVMTSSLQGSPSLEHFTGFVIAMHRKMTRQEVYFISSQSNRPSLFGLPLIIPCDGTTTHAQLYSSVWRQIARLVTPAPTDVASGSAANHAQDCDNSLCYSYPFSLKMIHREGNVCAVCPWYRFCRGCRIECDDQMFNRACCYVAIDWEPTALHLRYQASKERAFESDDSVEEAARLQREPIDLDRCLRDFTREEELGEDELYYCSQCQQHRLAKKRLQIWKLPPHLIIHLKRFQYLNGRWVKSNKIVEFPVEDFDPSKYIALKMDAEDGRDDPLGIGDGGEGGSSPITTFSSPSANGGTHGRDEGSEKPAKEGGEGSRKTRDGGSEVRDATRDERRLRQRHISLCDYGDSMYDLYAVSCHAGMLGCGHYITFARNPDDKWYCFNDSGVKEAEVSGVDHSTAYILMYERRGLDKASFLSRVTDRDHPQNLEDDDDAAGAKKYCPIQ